jgi:hypothetical protein
MISKILPYIRKRCKRNGCQIFNGSKNIYLLTFPIKTLLLILKPTKYFDCIRLIYLKHTPIYSGSRDSLLSSESKIASILKHQDRQLDSITD